jgi:hypothetical protein
MTVSARASGRCLCGAVRYELLESGGLRWIENRDSDSRARRGFCGECGSSLFLAGYYDLPEGGPRRHQRLSST